MPTDNPDLPLLLIVEDDETHIDLIRHSFEDGAKEYRLEIARTLRDAAQAIERRLPDLILTNYLLADGDGNELVARVDGACPVILMTSRGSEQLAVSTIKAGALDYIAKSPEAFSSMPRIVKMALREWRLLQERRKITAAVSRGKREWEQTFDAVPDLILIIDTRHTISRANRAMARRCGLKPEELPGRKCYEVFHGLSAAPPFCPFVRLINDGAEQTEEMEESKLAGSFDVTVSPLYSDTGKLTACVHVARDITERKRADQDRLAFEQQIQQVQRLESLGVLAGGIAHDFNNILMVILGHCFLAKEAIESEWSDKSHLKQIEVAANRAADLCRQMLTYAGKSPLLQTQVDMRHLVDEILKMLKPAFKKNVCFEYDLDADVPEVTGDRAKIQQIIMNLVVNAVEAIGDNLGAVKVGLASVVVRSGQEEDFFGSAIAPGVYARLEVSDSGCGMDGETQKRIFEPFFSTKFAGRGLGMSAILGIIKSHNGALQLLSKPGSGTTFKVYLSVAEGAGLAALIREPDDEIPAVWTSGNSTNKTILLVDDEPELRKIGTDMLVAMGFSVITALNGRETLEIYSAQKSMIDLILTDLTMPEMDGIEAYHELRKIAPRIPIVICSGYSNDGTSSCIEGDENAGFVAKPYRPDQLWNMLSGLLGNRG